MLNKTLTIVTIIVLVGGAVVGAFQIFETKEDHNASLTVLADKEQLERKILAKDIVTEIETRYVIRRR